MRDLRKSVYRKPKGHEGDSGRRPGKRFCARSIDGQCMPGFISWTGSIILWSSIPRRPLEMFWKLLGTKSVYSLMLKVNS